MLSITDIERIHASRLSAYGIDTGKTHMQALLREQGVKFSDDRFRALWAAWKGEDRVRRPRTDKLTKLLPAPSPAAPEGIATEPLADSERPVFGGKLRSPDAYRPRLEGTRFVFTCAQNNTAVHGMFFKSLLHFCNKTGSQLGVSRITYNKNGWAYNGGITKKPTEEDKELWYADEIIPYIADNQVKVADDLIFCGELDILPTAVYPLNGLHDYTGPNSAIVPHTKMQMQSLATMKSHPAKLLYTTGTCTLRNYIQRRTGQIADFHHVYGAVYVEIDADGEWFVRQLNADENGIFYDLDTVYGPGWDEPAINFGSPIVNLADIHVEKLNEKEWEGASTMLTALKPKAIMLHDLIDFEARNHHNKKDPMFLAKMYQESKDSVFSGFRTAYDFVVGLKQSLPETTLYSIRSNHDTAFEKWIVEGAGFIDPPNQEFWHLANYTMLKNIRWNRNTGKKFDMYRWAFQQHDTVFGTKIDDNITWVQEDESLVINGIEFGMHGHLGPNGARGNPKAFRQIGRRANTGHTHSAGIVDGIYTAGILAGPDMGYNRGPSSWSCSHIITYPNGKRAIITQRGNKWRA